MTLQKAQIKPLDGNGATIDVMFNPDQIVYNKLSGWTMQPTNGQTMPNLTYATGDPATLTVTLLFDGTEDGENVAKKVDKLTALQKVDSSIPNGSRSGGGGGQSQSRQHRPPSVHFLWGNYLSFKAVIWKVASTFSLFLDDGTPVRASVVVTFKQIEDEALFPDQNPTSGGRTGERVYRLGPRETLDQVAYVAFGQTALWRGLAAFNGIDDPLRLQAGDAILLPASVDDLKALA